VFNFALAKVHYIGLIGAADVRVFFRLFQAQSMATVFDFPPGGRYRRAASDPDGQPIPLAGIHGGEYATFPCFAEARVDSTTVAMDQQTDPHNVQTFTAGAGGAEVDRFYGCWLDFNQPFKPGGVTPNNVLPATVPGSAVDGPFTDPAHPPLSLQQAILRFPHQCLVAEIAFDPVAIPVGKDPGNWDKLAQRNLAWSDLGSAEALCNFEIKPTRSPLPVGAPPDELMMDWRRTPEDGRAEVYLPALEADEVLALADRMYATHDLSRVDAPALRDARITHIPIPPTEVSTTRPAQRRPPDHSAVANASDVIVRQVTNASGERRQSPPLPGPGSTRPPHSARALRPPRSTGGVCLAPSSSIPVKDKAILPARRAAALGHALDRASDPGSEPLASRLPPLPRTPRRPRHQLRRRPDPDEPSPTGQGKRRPTNHPSPGPRAYRQDRWPPLRPLRRLRGFILETDGQHHHHHHFHSREPAIAALVQRAHASDSA
jgi:hypothetical protein